MGGFTPRDDIEPNFKSKQSPADRLNLPLPDA